MTWWCVEHLHRLPQELTKVGAGALAKGMNGYGRVAALLQERAEEDARRHGPRD